MEKTECTVPGCPEPGFSSRPGDVEILECITRMEIEGGAKQMFMGQNHPWWILPEMGCRYYALRYGNCGDVRGDLLDSPTPDKFGAIDREMSRLGREVAPNEPGWRFGIQIQHDAELRRRSNGRTRRISTSRNCGGDSKRGRIGAIRREGDEGSSKGDDLPKRRTADKNPPQSELSRIIHTEPSGGLEIESGERRKDPQPDEKNLTALAFRWLLTIRDKGCAIHMYDPEVSDAARDWPVRGYGGIE